MNKLYVVATVKHIGKSIFFGDIILITPDKKHAKTVTYHVKEHRPIPGLDYDKLVVFDDAMYFERELNKINVRGAFEVHGETIEAIKAKIRIMANQLCSYSHGIDEEKDTLLIKTIERRLRELGVIY